MPVQKKITQNETAEIRCQLMPEGNYHQAAYFFRYFQTDGKGELRMDNGAVLKPNDLDPLRKEVFRLYYKFLCSDQQSIDVYLEDRFRKVIQKTFSFTNEGTIDLKPAAYGSGIVLRLSAGLS